MRSLIYIVCMVLILMLTGCQTVDQVVSDTEKGTKEALGSPEKDAQKTYDNVEKGTKDAIDSPNKELKKTSGNLEKGTKDALK